MSISRRSLIKNLALALPALRLSSSFAQSPLTNFNDDGYFKATRESLQSYEIPQWFRDAKFGIWAHWGPQSAIEAGDWYARNMYIQGQKQYKYHLDHYGHPSKFGYKDTIQQWKAEQFDADHLVGLYKKAGAKYFMTMGAHHDNFLLWDSKYTRWNSMKMGPKKDIVGLFREASHKHGLKFGISDHLWISPKWFSVSKGSDKEGPYKGVPYDGTDLRNADLYGDAKEIFINLPWDENGISEEWKKHWSDSITELIDKYEPDLLYCDGHIPFEKYGLGILAHLYNKTAKRNKKTTGVYTSKRAEDSAVGSCVYDVERGVVDGIWPRPWQTDTCIGDWHYNKERVGNYKSVKTVVDLLVDIVSRNGNLMLNFPLPASGRLDSDELNILDGITKWMDVNSEGIYATRPWKIFGDGPSTQFAKTDVMFNERNRKPFTADEQRFTIKKGKLYAFVMGWPQSQQVIIKSLSSNSQQKTGSIERVELLGHGMLQFSRDMEGLKINLPDQKPCEHAITFKISGKNLV